MKIGIIREEKLPHDKRVPFTPVQCKQLMELFKDLQIVVQPCDYRCYTNEEYKEHGIKLSDDVSDCDVLMGIKEVPKEFLLEGKKYFFFSHTIKKQPHNKALLQTILKKKVTLIDYETLTDPEGNRVIGFGRFAGIVGQGGPRWGCDAAADDGDMYWYVVDSSMELIPPKAFWISLSLYRNPSRM